jgi:hypothetical protein
MRGSRLPGFTAAATLDAPKGSYRSAGAPDFPEASGQAILPQQFGPVKIRGGWRIKCYLQCTFNNGRERICCRQPVGSDEWDLWDCTSQPCGKPF